MIDDSEDTKNTCFDTFDIFEAKTYLEEEYSRLKFAEPQPWFQPWFKLEVSRVESSKARHIPSKTQQRWA